MHIYTERLQTALLSGVFALLLASCAADRKPETITPQQVLNAPPAYNYPIANPYAATIIGVPPEMKVDYSKLPKAEEKTITLFNGRAIPEGFWYEDGFKYSRLIQTKPAPIVYIIAGTGADSKGETIRTMGNILYSAGFSVVMLPSPTHPNFIINASRNYIVGRPAQDAEDMYRAMKNIEADVAAHHTITGHMLVGYSLGGLDAVYTAKLDDEQQSLRFSKVLLINPPYNLYSSMQLLDEMLYKALPNGINDADKFVKSAVARLSSMSQSSDALNFQNERTLLDAYNTYKPSDARLATTIGLSFRLAAADMIFTSDVMCHCNYIFPGNQDFTTSTSLNHYLAVALRTSFRNYFYDIYTEQFLSEDRRLNRQSLIGENSMQSLAGYLAAHPKIGLMTNRDDVILAPGELEKLVALFKGDVMIYPNGGHLGNLEAPAVTYHIVEFMKQ
jgi:pimeloyl-ACP methyl ester carboxylesterase